MAKNAPTTRVGDVVTLAGESDHFTVTAKDRSMLVLRNERTRKKTRAHFKKVVAVMPAAAPSKVEKAPAVDDESAGAEEMSLADALEVEEPEGIKRKTPPAPVDFAALRAESSEILVKRMKFDHAHVLAESWYVISKDRRSARNFNTYGRSLGRRQKETTVRVQAIKDDADLERRIKRLEKNGYKRFEG